MLRKHGWTTYFSPVRLPILYLCPLTQMAQCWPSPRLKEQNPPEAKFPPETPQYNTPGPPLEMTSPLSELR